jgi:hypothetical protein
MKAIYDANGKRQVKLENQIRAKIRKLEALSVISYKSGDNFTFVAVLPNADSQEVTDGRD